MYVSEEVVGPDGSLHPLTIEELHVLIKDALGREEPIVKLTLDEITIRNSNGLRFMFKKAEPKLDVTFEGTEINTSSNYYKENIHAPVVPVSVQTTITRDNKWLTVLDTTPASFGHTATVINEHMFVFGGYTDEATTNHSILLSDTRGGKFSKLKVRGEIPPPRERHSASLIGKKIYVFGGYNRGPEVYYNSLYCFESETLTWTKIEPRGQPPDKRCGHTATVVDGKIFIFGGRVKTKGESWFSESGVQYRNDLHCYDVVTNEWLRYEPRGIGPSGRALASATVVGRKIFIFGGANSSGSRNDTSGFCDLYELDIDTMCWSECETNNTPPTPCYGHSATLIGDHSILFFGGKGYKILNSIHVLDTKKMEWKQYAYAGNQLAPRWGHTATLHDTRVLIYGGRSPNGYYNTLEQIDINNQLIELTLEETEKDKIRRKEEQKKQSREAIGNLQSAVSELQAMASQIEQEIITQKKQLSDTKIVLSKLKENNASMKKKLASLLIGDITFIPPKEVPVISTPTEKENLVNTIDEIVETPEKVYVEEGSLIIPVGENPFLAMAGYSTNEIQY